MDDLEHTLYHELSEHIRDLEAKDGVPTQQILDIYSGLSAQYRTRIPIEQYSRVEELKYMKDNFDSIYEAYKQKYF